MRFLWIIRLEAGIDSFAGLGIAETTVHNELLVKFYRDRGKIPGFDKRDFQVWNLRN
jgi:hypothetical protein